MGDVRSYGVEGILQLGIPHVAAWQFRCCKHSTPCMAQAEQVDELLEALVPMIFSMSAAVKLLDMPITHILFHLAVLCDSLRCGAYGTFCYGIS